MVVRGRRLFAKVRHFNALVMKYVFRMENLSCFGVFNGSRSCGNLCYLIVVINSFKSFQFEEETEGIKQKRFIMAQVLTEYCLLIFLSYF